METRIVGVAVIGMCIVAALMLSGCPLDEPPVPEGVVRAEALSVDAEGLCDVVFSITNVGGETISHVDFVFRLSAGEQVFYRRIVESVAVLPGESMGIIETLALPTADETVLSISENLKILWASFS